MKSYLQELSITFNFLFVAIALTVLAVHYQGEVQKERDLQVTLMEYRTDEVGPTEYSIELLNPEGFVRVWSHSTETVEILHVDELDNFFCDDNL